MDHKIDRQSAYSEDFLLSAMMMLQEGESRTHEDEEGAREPGHGEEGVGGRRRGRGREEEGKEEEEEVGELLQAAPSSAANASHLRNHAHLEHAETGRHRLGCQAARTRHATQAALPLHTRGEKKMTRKRPRRNNRDTQRRRIVSNSPEASRNCCRLRGIRQSPPDARCGHFSRTGRPASHKN